MRNENFSEFSYGFALTDELIHWYGTTLTAAPIFPSLQEEGRVGGGYDVKLPGIPLFLQFKLSDRMERNNAVEVGRDNLLRTYFYRIHLRPLNRSAQHQLLLALESEANLVFYAGPAFFELAELNDAYRDHQVAQRSVFIRPSAIGPLPDDERHHIAFQDSSSSFGYRYSRPERVQRVRILTGKSLSMEVEERLKSAKKHQLTNAELSRIAQSMIATIAKLSPTEEKGSLGHFPLIQDRLTPLQLVAYLSRTYFDSTLFVVRPKNKSVTGPRARA